MLSIQLNDDSVRLLSLMEGTLSALPPGGLTAGLEDIIRRGIVRRGQVLVWADSVGNAERASVMFPDHTGWECADSSFHLEDRVPVDVPIVDDVPVIIEADQRTLLIQGLTFGVRFALLVYALEELGPVRCIIGANETNATFRFHQIRPGERWNMPDLDSYKLDKMIVIDIEQPASC
jgi:hypothetical protein